MMFVITQGFLSVLDVTQGYGGTTVPPPAPTGPFADSAQTTLLQSGAHGWDWEDKKRAAEIRAAFAKDKENQKMRAEEGMAFAMMLALLVD